MIYQSFEVDTQLCQNWFASFSSEKEYLKKETLTFRVDPIKKAHVVQNIKQDVTKVVFLVKYGRKSTKGTTSC